MARGKKSLSRPTKLNLRKRELSLIIRKSTRGCLRRHKSIRDMKIWRILESKEIMFCRVISLRIFQDKRCTIARGVSHSKSNRLRRKRITHTSLSTTRTKSCTSKRRRSATPTAEVDHGKDPGQDQTSRDSCNQAVRDLPVEEAEPVEEAAVEARKFQEGSATSNTPSTPSRLSRRAQLQPFRSNLQITRDPFSQALFSTQVLARRPEAS